MLHMVLDVLALKSDVEFFHGVPHTQWPFEGPSCVSNCLQFGVTWLSSRDLEPSDNIPVRCDTTQLVFRLRPGDAEQVRLSEEHFGGHLHAGSLLWAICLLRVRESWPA